MQRSTIFYFAGLLLATFATVQGASDEITHQCNSVCQVVQSELNQNNDCRSWRRMNPRPKIGQKCGSGFSEGFMNSCWHICEHKLDPTHPDHALVGWKGCESSKNLMPKPTMYDACISGWDAAIVQTRRLLDEKLGSSIPGMDSEDSADEPEAAVVEEQPVVAEEPASKSIRGEQQESEPVAEAVEEEAATATSAAAAVEEEEAPQVRLTLSITVDANEEELIIFVGQDIQDAVNLFCQKHMATAGSACNRQLLPRVQEKLRETDVEEQ